MTFTPSILPAYLHKTEAIEELIPWLYLKGISTGDFAEALQSLVGERAKGLSANVVVRLKEQWCEEYEEWSKRNLSEKHYVYIWADGIHAKVRLEDDANKKQCLLVLMGATAEGQKELIAVLDGYRESEQSWSELLLDLKQRGLLATSRARDLRCHTAFGTRPASVGGLSDTHKDAELSSVPLVRVCAAQWRAPPSWRMFHNGRQAIMALAEIDLPSCQMDFQRTGDAQYAVHSCAARANSSFARAQPGMTSIRTSM